MANNWTPIYQGSSKYSFSDAGETLNYLVTVVAYLTRFQYSQK